MQVIIPAPPPTTRPTAFDGLPGWPEGNTSGAALEAFLRSCARWQQMPPDAPVSPAADYAGTVADWVRPCAEIAAARSADEAFAVFERDFLPLEIVPDGETRFTGYFEPEIEVRYQPYPPYTEPLAGIPTDLIQREDGSALQRLRGGGTRAYPARGEIDLSSLPALAYGRPADVFFLQIQGSGRIRFEDGQTIRAAYAGNNGHRFRSTANWLMEKGYITRREAGMEGITAWMARAPAAQVREAINANPRYIFFRAEPITDPREGPKGAMGVPLTPLGSIAVDTTLHPLGVPVFVDTLLPDPNHPEWGSLPFSGLFVAQDTGNAIRGVVRGDLYFGTGSEAGRWAGRMNAPGRMWVLLPRPVAERLSAAGGDMAGLSRPQASPDTGRGP